MMQVKADLVLKNGRVFLGLDRGFAQGLAVFRDRVLASGSDGELAGLVGPGTRVIDLRGRLAVPGFNDAHQHLMALGFGMIEVDLRGSEVKTIAELLERVRQRAAAAKPGEWILGGRYDHFQLDVKRHPLREELDIAAPNNPVYLKRTCGHMGVANSAALALAGVDERTPQPSGGHIESQNGRLTGLMQERAQELIARVLPRTTQETLIRAIELGGRHLLSHGTTSAMDAAVGLRQGWDDYLAYQEARRQRRLPVRMYLAISGGPAGIQKKAHEEGLKTGVGDAHLKVGSVKLFTDGSAGGKTAAMSEPYICSCNSTGIFLFSDAEIDDMVMTHHLQGNQLSIHAIGDAAVEQAIRAVEKAGRLEPTAGRRHRIEHCGFISDSQIARMAALGMTLAPQPIFIYEFGELYIDVLGERRPAESYPMRKWIDAGLRPAASSDAPVSDSNPMKNLYQMVTRKTARGRVIGGDQAISLAEAIHCATWNGAHGSFDEAEKGDLSPGMLADIAVIDRDLFAADPEEIPGALVDLTILGGAIVHDRLGEAA
ncbi:MAG: amidohydrolase [Thalassobaculales bacterium]